MKLSQRTYTDAIYKSDLCTYQKAILLAISHHFINQDYAWPSVDRLLGMTSMKRTALFKYLKKLKQENILTTVKKQGSIYYKINLQEVVSRTRKVRDTDSKSSSDGLNDRHTLYRNNNRNKKVMATLKGSLGEDTLIPETEVQVGEEINSEEHIGEDMKSILDIQEKGFIKDGLKKKKSTPLQQCEAGWKSVLVNNYDQKMVSNFTGKQKGQVNQILKRLVDNPEKVEPVVLFTRTLERWDEFIHLVKSRAGLKTVPLHPDIGFLLKYVDTVGEIKAVQLIADRPKVTKPSNKPKASKKMSDEEYDEYIEKVASEWD